MSAISPRLPSSLSQGLRGRIIGLFGALVGANLLVWGTALVVFQDYPLLLGTALLAYTFGLRHAVDADHIAAIDNVTRKLMQEGQRPLGVGLFFSLGHSTIVIALSVALAAGTVALENRFEGIKAVGGVIGTGISAFFLFAIAAANLLVLRSIYLSFRRVRQGGASPGEAELNGVLCGGGVLSRLCGRLFRLIGRSWQMYPLGLLFGLGFDTASEIGLLGISASQAAQGLSIWSILLFPALFTAGMSLIDSADSVLMLGAYQWAFVKPIRKLYYNLTITFVSVAIALLVGGVETLGLLADQLHLEGMFWESIGRLNDNFGLLGFLIIGLFLASWLVSAAIYRIKGYDEIEALP
jgi:high-affinity nickel-transport protein